MVVHSRLTVLGWLYTVLRPVTALSMLSSLPDLERWLTTIVMVTVRLGRVITNAGTLGELTRFTMWSATGWKFVTVPDRGVPSASLCQLRLWSSPSVVTRHW